MDELSTRELILQSALRLFATEGYAAVSMRDIAADVGIRASSIYHHFTGKQELLDALLAEAGETKDAMERSFSQALARTASIEREAFIRAGLACVTEYLQSPRIAPLLKVLEGERFRNEQASAAWRELLTGAPMRHEENVFRVLMMRGDIPEGDAQALAAEYQAAIVLAYLTEDTARLRAMLDRFYTRVFIKE